MRTKILRLLTLAVGLIAVGAVPAFANDVTLTADCTEYTISASFFDTATISYTITLTPASGPPIMVGPFSVSNGGSDSKTWAQLGVTLNGDYTLSLSTNPSPSGEMITITPPTLTCHPTGQPQLSVTKSPKNGTFASGSQVSFSIIVGNPGDSAATNVQLNDQLPGNGGLSFISVTTTQGTCTLSTTNFLHCDLGTIGPGASVTITVSSDTTTPASACQSQPNPKAQATADGGLSAQDSGSMTCAPPGGKTFTIGPSSMEGAIRISNGDWVNGGYSFQFKSNSHIATDYTVTASVSITGPCSNGGTDTVIVPLGTVTYPVPAGNTSWLPTGDANSVLSWQGSVRVGVNSPSICGGTGQLNASKGAVYTSTVSQNPPTGSLVAFRFKFRDPAAKGKPNTNCLDTSDPNRAKADVCGASWSQTVTDP
jgi:uncharacterized repeat protein (TIGR01451 family)